MRVQFQLPGGTVQNTPWEMCSAGLSMNFYLAGLMARQYLHRTSGDRYRLRFRKRSGRSVYHGRPAARAVYRCSHDPESESRVGLDSARRPLGASPVANDLSGNVLWYGPVGMTFLTRVEAGGEFWGIVEALGDASQQVVRKFDLTGMTLLETNAARVNEQLTAMGKRTITGFHHEARPIRRRARGSPRRRRADRHGRPGARTRRCARRHDRRTGQGSQRRVDMGLIRQPRRTPGGGAR